MSILETEHVPINETVVIEEAEKLNNMLETGLRVSHMKTRKTHVVTHE